MADPVVQSPKNPHFFQPLLPGFDSHLNIPVTFYSKFIQGRKEYKTAKLRSDASDTTWEVTIDNGRRLTGGWRDFAIAHDIRVGDVIVFRHEGDLVFHVTIFGPSCCEIQYVQDNNIRNLSMEENLKTEPESFSSEKCCFIAHVTNSNLQEDRLFIPKKIVMPDGLLKKGRSKITLMNEGAKTWTLSLLFRESTRTFYMRAGWRSFCHENGLEPGDSVTFILETSNTKAPLLRFSTSEQKSDVFTKYCRKRKRTTGRSSQRMSSSQNESRFVKLTVTAANLKHNSLYLPSSFTRVNKMNPAGGKKIILLDKHGVEWPVTLQKEKNKNRMRLGSGSKQFLQANGVKANESFVLELVWENRRTPPMLKFCSKI